MAVDVTPDVQRVTQSVCVQLADHLRAVVAHGPEYARRYVESAMTSGTTPRTVHLHPDLAHLVRDLVQEELTFERRGRRE